MLRIMIIDDEETIRIGLEKMILKAREDCQIVGSYGNGEDALLHLARQEPDLVITDIKMPYMDGLRFIELLKEKRPHVRCVILSGYNDFDYARKAILYGVNDYLIKPVDKKELLRNLDQIAAELGRERMENEREMELWRKARWSDLMAKEDALRRLLLGELEETQALELARAHGLLSEAEAGRVDEADGSDGSEGAGYAVLALRSSDSHAHERLLAVLRGKLLQQTACTVIGERLAAVLLRGTATGEVKRFGYELLMETRDGASSLVIGISKPCANLQSLPQAYSEALEASLSHFYWPDMEPVTIFGEAVRGYLDSERIAQLLDTELGTAFEHADPEAVRSALRRLFEELARTKPPYDEVVHLAGNVLFVAALRCDGFGEEVSRLTKPGFNFYQAATLPFTLDELRHWLGSLLDDAFTHLASKRTAPPNRLIETVKQAIQNDYTREIELTELSEKVYLNPSYLSTLFKQETGQTITQYLLSLRIAKAKELLRERLDLKVYEIGELVGYADAMYFNRLFKKMVGTTPKEFRNQVPNRVQET
ncbi:two-component system response regulator YesN [Paenibacillus taihuensis]|uniref:Two-component system response regulator YesN n=1 Tax=Paenibacillus taihuensis TaxID=1156355 RepID=A0A3D9RYS8_9BACL|nr:response regulator [Paenibacillus taihuensis]REE85153.1 two-component system response regulator YesN [Paenibacillus taihuensis]